METFTHCGRCGRQTPAGAHFCPGCGLDLRDGRAHQPTGLLPTNRNLFDRYVVIRLLAQGGQSAVYLVQDALSDGAYRAVKEMSESSLGPTEREQAINDFNREALMLSRLNHPALAKVYETFVEGQKHYLVMEYVGGHNLEDELISKGRPLEWQRVLGWGIALCDVLAYVHAQEPPIIYRDLKPANVMLTADGAIKLIDFGIARWLHPMRARDTTQLGTDGYAPLEQYSSRSEPRSDLYALGASLYHLLTGRVPEAAPGRIAGHPLVAIRAINPQVPENVERVIMRALQLQARDRFETAAQMRDALDWTLRHETGAPLPHRATYAPAPASARLGIRASSGIGGTARGGGTPAALPPRLHLWPLRLDAGFLEIDGSAVMLMEVGNRGGGELTGIVETNMPACLAAEPRVIEPDVSSLQVRIETTGLGPGLHTFHLAFRTNGGDQIVPVRFFVRPPGGPIEHFRRPTSY